jgi:hypothetical protein
VTGASKGIGKGIALQLGSSGAKVYITGRSEDLLQECAAEINARGGKAFPIPVDHFNDKVTVPHRNGTLTYVVFTETLILCRTAQIWLHDTKYVFCVNTPSYSFLECCFHRMDRPVE